MKVALVPDYLDEYGGAERTFEVLCEMFPQAEVFTLLYNPLKMPSKINQMRINISSYFQRLPNFIKKNRFLLVHKFPLAIENFDLSDFDLVISSGSFSKGLITKPQTIHIFYCHRLMRSLWEKHAEFIDEQKGFLKKIYIRYQTKKLRIWDFLAADRPDYIIANSYYTQKQINKFYRRKSKVIYPPINLSEFKVNKEREDYYLMVTRLGPFDKVDLAIRAFNESGKHLVIIGDGPLKKDFQKLAGKNIDILGHKPPEVLVEYYASAKGFISLGEETFGLAEVEAMASGTPIIAYKKGGVKETVVAGESGEFFDKLSVREIIKAINFVEKNYSRYDHYKIRSLVEKFDKKHFKEKLESFIQEVVKK